MASYTKTMMEIAKTWIAANPDMASDALHLPGKSTHVPLATGTDVTETRRRALEMLHEYPALSGVLQPLMDKTDRAVAEHGEASIDLAKAELELERIINEGIAPQHTKHMVDGHMHTDLGRWFLSWARHGYNVFDLSSDFVAAMLMTDPRDLDIADVMLPFSGLLVLVPDGFAKGIEGTSYTKIHVCEVSAHERSLLKVDETFIRHVRSMPVDSVSRVIDKVQASIDGAGVPIPPRSLLGRASVINIGGNGKALHIYATDGVRVLDTFVERDGLTWDAFDDLPDSVTEVDDREARSTLRRIVFGTLAYVAAVGSAMERRTSGKRKMVASDAQPAMWDVGRTIRLDPRIVRSARSGAREVAFRLKHRHIVRGHYRQQPVGPGRTERKRIHIQPFWKGPMDGAQLIHTYKIYGGKLD